MQSVSHFASAALLVLFAAIGAQAAYNPALALQALYYSNAVKCKPGSTVQDWTCGPSCVAAGPLTNITFVYNDTLEARGFVGYDAATNTIVQSYRGTKTFLNWLEDFDFKKVPYTADPGCGADCEVHQGFFVTYEFMAQTIIPATAGLLEAHPAATVLVTGHSLGAAQSQFGIIDVMKLVAASSNPNRNVSLINFGCPRVGNAAFADWAMTKLAAAASTTQAYRVVHANDPVPMVPLVSMGFQHFPREFIWYNKSVPSPGWLVCNKTGVQSTGARQPAAGSTASTPLLRLPAKDRLLVSMQAEAAQEVSTSCGSEGFWHLDVMNHVWYLGIPMNCKMDPYHHY